jgi:hypothetical protein
MNANNCSMIVLSCDKYNLCWKPFFKLLDKYYPDHPKTYLVCENKKCQYSETININNSCWTARFREALKKIPTDYVIVMLDDFFIREPVDSERINKTLLNFNSNAIVYNFEKQYRQPSYSSIDETGAWDIQSNNQMYLNSCQPSLWDRKKLINRLQKDETAWDWEITIIDSDYFHFINNSDAIIEVGRAFNLNWGIARGRVTDECIAFLKRERLYEDFDNNTIL